LGTGNTYDQYTPYLITSIKNVIQVSLGALHTLVLASGGIVYSFGDNSVK
jgi:alpha-tubulin suppressor-like RCC1 family protein